MVKTLLSSGSVDGSWSLNKSLILKLKTILDLDPDPVSKFWNRSRKMWFRPPLVCCKH